MNKAQLKNLGNKYKIDWRNYYTGQNLVSVRIASLIFFLLNAVIRVLYLVFPLSLTKANNFPEFNLTNWVFFGSSLSFYLLSYLMLDLYRKRPKATAILSLFTFGFAMYLIICGMYSSFIATSDPKNALVLYLIALSTVSILFVFEYYETIMLIIAAELVFTSLLIWTETESTEMVYDQIISFVLLGGFYLISRYFFSYKSNYYLQVIEIKEKNLEIERSSDFKSQLLGTVAHDLRNPIAAIETLAMVMEMDEIDAELQENINIIKASCVQARTIIEELLESARNQNTAEFITVRTDLDQFMAGVISKWENQKGSKTIELNCRVVPAWVQLNHEKFQRVIDNLIGNALKFSGEGGTIEIDISKKNFQIIIEVKDQGIGIPKEKLPIIFDAFTKAGRPGLKGEQSTGLGLSIVKQIVEKHDGTIEVESEEGKGSVFRVTLPEDGL
ncbi:HAMP domain-containing sensor histidine kinase [Mucilaginibacter sp.]|uniref:sensor histidine kinase n=1 Tax=Mucilaginibacter sp. TaxID=1882438 RepID=UPI00284FD28F|nr:HAMP domain-containing sensor histidine kinase [Mucilaginibacter sp.]MDR3693733.1 HAMP domain-containing sensor histidine kinase [Mucilaginibacter sp.]